MMTASLTEWLIYNPEGTRLTQLSLEDIEVQVDYLKVEFNKSISFLASLHSTIGKVSMESFGYGVERFDVKEATKKIIEYIRKLFTQFIQLLKQAYRKVVTWTKNNFAYVSREAKRFKRYQDKSTQKTSVTVELSDPWLFNAQGELVTIAGNGYNDEAIVSEGKGGSKSSERGTRAYQLGNSSMMVIGWAMGADLFKTEESTSRSLREGKILRTRDSIEDLYSDIASKEYAEDRNRHAGGWYMEGVTKAIDFFDRTVFITLDDFTNILRGIRVVVPNLQITPEIHRFTNRSSLVKELHRLADRMLFVANNLPVDAVKLEETFEYTEEYRDKMLKELESDDITEERKEYIQLLVKEFNRILPAANMMFKLSADIINPLVKTYLATGQALEKGINEFDK